MIGSKGWRIVAAVAVVGIALAAVAPPLLQRLGSASADSEVDVAERCERAVAEFVDALQAHADTVSERSASELAEDPPSAEAEAQRYSQRVAALECDEERTDELLAEGLDGLRADGAVSELAVDSVRSSVLGQWPSLEEVSVGVSDDLAAVVAVAPADLTLTLEAGEHEVSESLVVRQAMTLRGAGSEQTRIASSSEEVALLHAGTGTLRIEGLTLAHVGSAPASVLVVDEGSYELAQARLTGGVTNDDGAGGAGMVLGPEEGDEQARRAPGRVAALEDVEVDDNEGAGMIVRGAEAPVLSGVAITGSGSCGVCFLAGSAGEVRDSRLSDNEVAVLVGGRAAPLVADSEIEGNRRSGLAFEAQGGGVFRDNLIAGNGGIGVIASDDAGPVLAGNDIGDHGEAGLVLGGASAAEVSDNAVDGSPVAVWLEGEAAPTLEGNALGGGESAGIVYAESSAGGASDNEIAGFDIGIEARDEAAPSLQGNALTDSGEAAMLFRDDAEGAATGNRCDGGEARIVLADSAGPSLDDNDCRLDDLR